VHFSSPYHLLKATSQSWWNDRAMSMGAAISFYTVFSLAPMLLLVISVAGLVFGREASQGAVIEQMKGLIGEKGGEAVSTMLASASAVGSGVVATVVGVVSLVIFSTGAFVELQDDLNIIWKAKRPTYSSLLIFLRSRFASLSLIVAIGFLLLVSLIIDAGVTAASRYFARFGLSVVIEITNFVVALGASTTLFALIFKVLPSTRVAWKDVWIGAVATGVMFLIGKSLIGIYLGQSNLASNFGAAGSVITILLWVYYSSQILLFGAEFTKVYAELRGSRSTL
jgi:membrane protein